MLFHNINTNSILFFWIFHKHNINISYSWGIIITSKAENTAERNLIMDYIVKNALFTKDLQQQSGRPPMMGEGQMNGRPPMPPQGGQFGEQPQSDSETESTTEV